MKPSAAVEAAISRVGDDPLNAWITLDGEGARTRAARLEDEGAQGRPLWGRVVSVKDNLAVAGVRMTCGSRHLEEYVAPYSASVVERLEEAGAIVLGKTNLDEFGCGSSGENSAFGAARNPRDPDRVPGGSSSGGGVSVAAGHVDLALGSDTGGSVRCPAAWCGVVGFKPSQGLVSRYGLADLAMSLESPAPLARTVEDCARLLVAMAGEDPRDQRTRGARAPEVALEGDARGLCVGVVKEFLEGATPEVDQAVEAALDRLRARGATLTEVSLSSLRFALPAYYVINTSEFASAMQRFDGFRYGTPGEGGTATEATADARRTLGREVKRRILLGTFATSREERGRWYDKALAVRARLKAEIEEALAACDVLMGPTMPFTAFELGTRVKDPVQLYASDVLTVSANLAGVPAGSVPVRSDGLPVGLQVLGAHGEDARVLDAMRAVERLEGVSA